MRSHRRNAYILSFHRFTKSTNYLFLKCNFIDVLWTTLKRIRFTYDRKLTNILFLYPWNKRL